MAWVITMDFVCLMVTDSDSEVVEDIDYVTSMVSEFEYLLFKGWEGVDQRVGVAVEALLCMVVSTCSPVHLARWGMKIE